MKNFILTLLLPLSLSLSSCGGSEQPKKQAEARSEPSGKPAENTKIPDLDISKTSITLKILNPDNCKEDCTIYKKEVSKATIGQTIKTLKVPKNSDVILSCLGYNLKTDMPNIIPIEFDIYSQSKTYGNEGKWREVMGKFTENDTWHDVCMKKRTRQFVDLQNGTIDNDFTGPIVLPPLNP